ncbi:MAG: hypothetical protein JXR83_20510 [Deltaproteobacteria bacterium]|nr:hypothetical protein [Deltaproteobacteria bacterium]
MRIAHLAPPALLGALALLACTDPQPAADAGAASDAGVGDRATGQDRSVGYDVHFPRRDAGSGCGDVTSAGNCDDAGVLTWCEDDAVQSVDCTAIGYQCGAGAGGYWCLAGPGQSCRTWPCREPLYCGTAWICTGWPDGGARDRPGEDRPGAERTAEDAAG